MGCCGVHTLCFVCGLLRKMSVMIHKCYSYAQFFDVMFIVSHFKSSLLLSDSDYFHRDY